MNCPKCETSLVKKYYKGFIEVDACPICRGMWLDFDELDTLEDSRFSADSLKGSLIHKAEPTEYACPHCGDALHEFEYRLYNLKLDYCPRNKHGFWLDAGEESRATAIMEQRANHISRKNNAESDGYIFLRKIKSRSFFDQIFK